MDIKSGLISKFDKEMRKFTTSDYNQFEKELDFTDQVCKRLDNINISASGQSIRVKVKKMHQSPIVTDFPRKWYVPDTDPEMADFLFSIHFLKNHKVSEQRVSLSQAKHVRGVFKSMSDRKWGIKMHQHYFLHTSQNSSLNGSLQRKT
jgi:hypothetical protein